MFLKLDVIEVAETIQALQALELIDEQWRVLLPEDLEFSSLTVSNTEALLEIDSESI